MLIKAATADYRLATDGYIMAGGWKPIWGYTVIKPYVLATMATLWLPLAKVGYGCLQWQGYGGR